MQFSRALLSLNNFLLSCRAIFPYSFHLSVRQVVSRVILRGSAFFFCPPFFNLLLTFVPLDARYRRGLHTNQRYRLNGKRTTPQLLPAIKGYAGLRHIAFVPFSVKRYQLFHSTIAQVRYNQRKCWGYCHHTHISSLDISTLHSLPFVPVLPIPAEQLNTD
ncbi:hypothetical protein QCG_3607, partial [Clostridioides difficile CD43]